MLSFLDIILKWVYIYHLISMGPYSLEAYIWSYWNIQNPISKATDMFPSQATLDNRDITVSLKIKVVTPVSFPR